MKIYGTDMESYYDLFISFLKKKGCESEFQENFFRFNRFTVFCRDIWDILGGDEYFINRAFKWADTPQGRDYWLAIDSAWEKVYMEQWRKTEAKASSDVRKLK